jgi:pantothenate kinase type III
MRLCLDIGNSQLDGGVFDSGLLLQFRKTTHPLGCRMSLAFFTAVLKNGIDPAAVRRVAICSWCRPLYPIAACMKYFRCGRSSCRRAKIGLR